MILFKKLSSLISLHFCSRFCVALKQNIRNRLKYLAAFGLIWLISTEFVVYAVWPLFWPTFKTNTLEVVKVLVVGDPQLIGYQNAMPSVFGYFARWDSDRFLEKTHHLAHNYIKPDITLFLGDNFDEGEIASDDEFDNYFRRFTQIFHQVNFSTAIILPGDNYIGGEHGQPIKSYEDRFNGYFKSVGFLQFKYVEFFKFNSMTRKRMYKRAFPRSKNVRILLSHIPLLPTMSPQAKNVIEELQPQLIISAHEHISVYMSMNPKEMELKNLQQTFTQNFKIHNSNMTDGNIHEIIVPASSYRMGTQKIGYGAFMIDSDGTVQYTVLWLPSRLKQLISYIILSVLIFLALCPGVGSFISRILPRNNLIKKR